MEEKEEKRRQDIGVKGLMNKTFPHEEIKQTK